ncbi:MAG: hypothetical protein KAH25_01310 [Bacteroidales bacterium]|nr:hypothetical protein [Bacteroidales bacterium]
MIIKRKSVLFSTVIYSVLLVVVMLLAVVIFVISSLNIMTDLHNFFFGNIIDAYTESALYFIMLILLMTIYAIVQIIRHKIHGLYLFFFLSAMVVIFIIQFQPIDLVNIFIVFVVNYVFFINRKWFKAIEASQDDDSQTKEDSISDSP